MTWAGFYMLCFVVGFALSFLSFLMGSFDVHMPDMHVHAEVGHFGMHTDGIHGGGQGDASGGGHGGASHGLMTEPHMSLFNFGTVTAFLAWFGGTGYLLTRYSGLWLILILALSTVAGLVGATVMFLFVAKFLMKHDKALNPADYDMVGVLGTLTMPIREGGTGEIVFSQEGSRRSAGARAEKGEAIAVGTEVVVTRYEDGIAYVRRWDELADDAGSTPERSKERK